MNRTLADAERDYDRALADGARAVKFMEEKLRRQERYARRILAAVTLAAGGRVDISHADMVAADGIEIIVEDRPETMGIRVRVR